MDTIRMWMDQPIAEVPRAELEDALADACQRIAQLEADLCESRVSHISDIGVFARRQHRGLLARLFK